MNLSAQASNKVLDALFRGQPLVVPDTYHIGLIKTDGEEVSGASYARLPIANAPVSWLSTQGEPLEVSTGDTKEIATDVLIDFGTALEVWGIVDRLRLYSASTGTDYWFDLKFASVPIGSNDHFFIPNGDLVLSFKDIS